MKENTSQQIKQLRAELEFDAQRLAMLEQEIAIKRMQLAMVDKAIQLKKGLLTALELAAIRQFANANRKSRKTATPNPLPVGAIKLYDWSHRR